MKSNKTPKSLRIMRQTKLKRLALMGILLSIIVVLSIIESYITVPFAIPGVKLGLSNIVVMYSLFFMKKSDSLLLVILKSCFVFLTRGVIAAFMSLCGGISSVIVMSIILIIFAKNASYLITSVAGAVLHNTGQIIAASMLLNAHVWGYYPVLLIAGIIAGITTSVLLKVTFPVISKLNLI